MRLGAVEFSTGIVSHLAAAAVQGTVFFCVVWAVCMVFRRLPAVWKCWLWRLVSIKFVLALCFAFSLSVVAQQPDTAPSKLGSLTRGVLNSLPQSEPTVSALRTPWPGHAVPHIDASIQPTTWLAALWLAGFLFVVAKDVFAWLQVKRLLRRAEDLSLGESPLESMKILARHGRRHPIRVQTVAHLSAPALIGLFKPTILMPLDEKDASSGAISSAVAHELAHLSRRDLDWIVVAEAVKAVFWFHPFAWLACREQRVEAEIAADQLARTWTGTSPKEYANHLLEWVDPLRRAEISVRAVPGTLQSTHELTKRMKAMSLPRYNRRSTAAFATILALPLALGFAPIRLTERPRQSNNSVVIPDNGMPKNVLVPRKDLSEHEKMLAMLRNRYKTLSPETIERVGTGGKVYSVSIEGGGSIDLLGITHEEPGRKLSWSADGVPLPVMLPFIPTGGGPDIFKHFHMDSKGVEHELKSTTAFVRQALVRISDPNLHGPRGYFLSGAPNGMNSNTSPMASHMENGSLFVIEQAFPKEARTADLVMTYYTSPSVVCSLTFNKGTAVSPGQGFQADLAPMTRFDFTRSHWYRDAKRFAQNPKMKILSPLGNMDKGLILVVDRPSDLNGSLRLALFDANGQELTKPFDLGDSRELQLYEMGSPAPYSPTKSYYWLRDANDINAIAEIRFSTTEERKVTFKNVQLQPNR